MTDAKGSKGFSRRSFLKGSTALGLSMGLFGLTACTDKNSGSKSVMGVQTGEKTFTTHTCPRNCYDTCSLIGEKVDGRIVRIVGDPKNPITAGTPCVKGQTHINVLYHPDRILHPLKRVGKKGEGKWEKITWDEAYATIVQKLKEAIDQYGSESIMPYNFSGTIGFVHQHGVPWRFFNKIGATNITRTVCNTGGKAALPYTYGDFSSIDPETFAKTKCYVTWGTNESYTNVHSVKFIQQARDNGAKLIVVNPHRHPLASQADLFIQLKPGTDAAFALGVQHIIINENLYDKDFVENYTMGFEELKKQVQNYPPSKVAQLCEVTEEEIREFVKMYTQAKPSIIRMGFGFERRTHGGGMVRAISFLPALMGVVGVEGGGFSYVNYNHYPFDNSYTKRPDLAPRKMRTINMNELGKAIAGELPTTKENPVKVLICFGGNPIPSAPNVNLIKKGLAREDLFTVVHEVFMTDTADYADIILPAAHFIEFEDVIADYLGWYVRYSEQGLEPMGESKSNVQLFNELAKQMGFTDECFNETSTDIIKKGILNKPIFKDITYENLRRNHWFKVDFGNVFSDHKFNTPSGKIEFYSENITKAGLHPVAEYLPEEESQDGSPALFAQYPINLLTPASPQLLSSQWHNVPYIQENLGEPFVTINAKDAEDRGIKDGDYCLIQNDRGQVKLKAKVSNSAVKAGVAVSFKSYWNKYTDGNTINSLAPDAIGDLDGISTYNTNLVQITKA
ncbi:Acetylene hydratase [bioreactor metagenome]|uniref:Acetylene hydratase n=1 Tax=bioreactor metagenome TaxID=1076179 RepID=A0A644U7G6_9ZZZZ|nr:molybdopterin-dependent oxidoreductase [Desulfitobacterium hafniense]MEA5024462.1 molybdopterin-dependent oxidoreductase [Desulfitobacterium hafniense]